MIKISRWNISLVLVTLILGLLLTTSYYTWQKTKERTPISRKRELIEVIKELEGKKRNLKNDLGDLRRRLQSLEKKAAADEGVLSSFKDQLNQAKSAAGLTSVRDDGIEVTLGDSTQTPLGKDPNNYIIHDYDLRAVVNALWAGGAEAISINGQRLVSVSAIRCAGNTILVNSTRLASPYRIRAIGDFNRLNKELNEDKESSQLLNNYAKMFSLAVDIEEKHDVEIPAYKGSLMIKYARETKD